MSSHPDPNEDLRALHVPELDEAFSKRVQQAAGKAVLRRGEGHLSLAGAVYLWQCAGPPGLIGAVGLLYCVGAGIEILRIFSN